MRVPGGDVIQRVGVINSGSGRALMVEYENASPNAVVVATVGSGVGPVSAELSGVRLDGEPTIYDLNEAYEAVRRVLW